MVEKLMMNKGVFQRLTRRKIISPSAICTVSVLAAAIMVFTGCSSISIATTSSTTPTQTSQTTTYTTEPTTLTTTTEPTTTSTTTTPTTTHSTITTPTKPITTPENFVDLQPYLIDGKSAIVAENSLDYRKIKIMTGITNIGTKNVETETGGIVVQLYKGGDKCCEWIVNELSVNQHVLLETTVGEMLAKDVEITPGINSFHTEIRLKNGTEPNMSNNYSDTYSMVLARLPTPVKEPVTDLEKIISNLFVGETKVFTQGDETEALNIVKPFLAGFGINYDRVSFILADYDYASTEYEKTFGRSFTYGLDTAGFVWGDSSQQRVVVENGTAVQVLPVLMRELIGASILQRNTGLMTATSNALEGNGNPLGGNEIILQLCTAYAGKALYEAGFGSYTNVSFKTTKNPFLARLTAPRDTIYVKSVLGAHIVAKDMAEELGYADTSQITSKDIENKLLELRSKPSDEVVSYFQEVVSKVYKMSNEEVIKIANKIAWNVYCDKELDPAFPKEIKDLLDPRHKYDTLYPDDLPPLQLYVLGPY
jgi:hypothetical protein